MADRTLSHSDIRVQFCAAIRQHLPGLSPAEIVLDDRIHRFTPNGDRPGSKAAWYVAYTDGRPAGAFGTWKGESHTWVADGDIKSLSLEERRALTEKIERQKAAHAIEVKAKQDRAATKASAIWNGATPAPADHPYLTRKRVPPNGVGLGTWMKWDSSTRSERVVSDHALLIPLQNVAGEIRNIQAIMPSKDNWLERDKDFLSGGQKSGLFYPIGTPIERSSGEILLISEGFATAATVHLATGYYTIMAIDAGNLIYVARAMRKMHPSANIVICADDDCHLPDNPGITKAYAAAYAIGGKVAEPPRRIKE